VSSVTVSDRGREGGREAVVSSVTVSDRQRQTERGSEGVVRQCQTERERQWEGGGETVSDRQRQTEEGSCVTVSDR
jgi:hypothetical protein